MSKGTPCSDYTQRMEAIHAKLYEVEDLVLPDGLYTEEQFGMFSPPYMDLRTVIAVIVKLQTEGQERGAGGHCD